jgi:hypothetical protein
MIKKSLSYINIIFTLLSALVSTTFMAAETVAQSYETLEPIHCEYNYAEGVVPTYSFEYLGSKKKLATEPGELAQVTFYIKNTGTAPFYSDDSGCKFRPVTRLGTAKTNDRWSPLHTTIYEQDSGWFAPNRIKLDQKRLDPEQEGSATFWIRTPQEEGIYREYFDLVVEGKHSNMLMNPG